MPRRHSRASSTGAHSHAHVARHQSQSHSKHRNITIDEPLSFELPLDHRHQLDPRSQVDEPVPVELVLYRQTQIDSSVTKMTAYALLALLFGAFQLALLAINFQSQEYIETEIFGPFHFGEFWAIFMFTVLEAFLLTTSGALEPLEQFGRLRYVYYTTMVVNIVLTFVAAVLLSMDAETFESPAHFIEYCAQIPIAMVDAVFVFIAQQYLTESKADADHALSVLRNALTSGGGLVSLLVVIASILQLLAYTDVIEASIPGEQVAHFFEFPIEFVNACIAVWFAVRTRDALLRRGLANLAAAH